MSKDILQKHDQGPLSQMMRELRVKNAEVGGILFSPVGKKDEEAFLFPTYVTRKEGEATVNEFLVVNQASVKTIQVSNVDKDHMPYLTESEAREYFADPSDVSQLIAKGPSSGGYKVKRGRLEFKVGDFELKIWASTTEWKLTNLPSEVPFFDTTRSGSFENCRLVNPTGDQVEKMLAANMGRVKGSGLREVSQKVSKVLGGTAS